MSLFLLLHWQNFLHHRQWTHAIGKHIRFFLLIWLLCEITLFQYIPFSHLLMQGVWKLRSISNRLIHSQLPEVTLFKRLKGTLVLVQPCSQGLWITRLNLNLKQIFTFFGKILQKRETNNIIVKNDSKQYFSGKKSYWTFTEQIFNGKLHFLSRECFLLLINTQLPRQWFFKQFPINR